MRCVECGAQAAEVAEFCVRCGAPADWQPPVSAKRDDVGPGNSIAAAVPTGTGPGPARARRRYFLLLLACCLILYCVILTGVLIAVNAPSLWSFHVLEDEPAGWIGVTIIAAFVASLTGTVIFLVAFVKTLSQHRRRVRQVA